MQIVGTVFDGQNLLPRHVVTCQGGAITDVSPESGAVHGTDARIELGEEVLVPGFIDMQVNGGGGALFNDSPDPETIARIGAAHRRFGTVAFLPTLISDTLETMRAASAAVERAMAQGLPGVLGIHLEGPFLNAARSGVHDEALFRRLDEECVDLVTTVRCGVTVVTLAPELASPLWIHRLTRAGIIVCAGHSAADYDQAREGIASGVSGFTHLFNAMTPLLSRAPGMVGAAIEDDETWFGIIADGHHVHPAAFRVAVTAKRRGGGDPGDRRDAAGRHRRPEFQARRQNDSGERHEMHYCRRCPGGIEPGHDVCCLQCGPLRRHRLVRGGTNGFPVPRQGVAPRSATRSNSSRAQRQFRGG